MSSQDFLFMNSNLPSSFGALESPHILAGNNASLSSELQSIQRVLSVGYAHLELLNAEVPVLQRAMAHRIQEGEKTEECLRQHPEAVSDVRRIPVELIGEIFALTLPHTRRVGKHTVQQGPWRLGHICRRWRDAALGYPLLWAAITIHNSATVSVKDACPLAMVETHLRRAGNMPLDVTFDWEGAYDDSELEHLLNLILQYSIRWETVHLRVHGTTLGPGPLLSRLNVIKGRIPLLRTLEITCTHGLAYHSLSVASDAFSVAPKLGRVTFTGEEYTEASIPPDILLPWDQVTYFRGAYPSQKDGLEVLLKTAPNIVAFGASLRQPNHRSPDAYAAPPQTNLILPRLRRLSLIPTGNFLKFAELTAPALQELWITGSEVGALLPFILRSSCALVKLVVSDCNNPATLVPVLAALPTLASFFISFSPRTKGTNALFTALTLTGGASVSTSDLDLCPNLSRVVAGAYLWFPLNTFLDMAESRSSSNFGASRLAFLRVFSQKPNYAPLERGVLRRMASLKDGGIDAEFDTVFEPSAQSYFGEGRP
ncbi:hypothetical protein C8R43DRAFT_1008775 [Mycena crocata]|nr:hypothetical protein C8R43DRAFT_1008775 [Mycena crocata]